MTPLMDLIEFIFITAVLSGTSLTLMRIHVMRDGLGSHALQTIMSKISIWIFIT
jgi:hypothetical protein